MRKLYHVQLKNTYPYKSNFYYGSIKAIFDDLKLPALNVSIHTLYKYSFDTYYENEVCYIFAGVLKTTVSCCQLHK